MIYLKCTMYLVKSPAPVGFEPNGPLFHRWLPDGENDAISLTTASAQNSLRVWFKRRGHVDGSFIRYVSDREEVDESTMRRQGWLDAGPLFGEAVFVHVSDSELAALREDRRGSAEYMCLGKRVIEFLFPALSGFLETLRLQYGQYWLSELKPWDSRQYSLGGYCQGVFHLRWRESESEDWRPFLPDDARVTIEARFPSGRDFGEYLTEQDWRQMQGSLSPSNALPLALRVAGRAHELCDLGHLAEAFIQAVTALELSVEHFLSARSAGFGESIHVLTTGFTGQPLKQQIAVLGVAAKLGESDILQAAICGVDTRNRIVHEAVTPSKQNLPELYALLKCSQLLLGSYEFKTPALVNGNQLTGLQIPPQ